MCVLNWPCLCGKLYDISTQNILLWIFVYISALLAALNICTTKMACYTKTRTSKDNVGCHAICDILSRMWGGGGGWGVVGYFHSIVDRRGLTLYFGIALCVLMGIIQCLGELI